jgi:hypothetical protein
MTKRSASEDILEIVERRKAKCRLHTIMITHVQRIGGSGDFLYSSPQSGTNSSCHSIGKRHFVFSKNCPSVPDCCHSNPVSGLLCLLVLEYINLKAVCCRKTTLLRSWRNASFYCQNLHIREEKTTRTILKVRQHVVVIGCHPKKSVVESVWYLTDGHRQGGNKKL